MSVPAGQMGGLQGAVNSGRVLSQGSPFAAQLLAKLLAAAGVAPGTSLGSLSPAQGGLYRQAAARALPVPGTMLSSLLGHAGLWPRGDFRTRNMGSGVQPSSEAIAASYGLGGSQVAPPVPVPQAVPQAGFAGPYAGPASGSGGVMGVPTPGADPYAQLTQAMLAQARRRTLPFNTGSRLTYSGLR